LDIGVGVFDQAIELSYFFFDVGFVGLQVLSLFATLLLELGEALLLLLVAVFGLWLLLLLLGKVDRVF